MNANPAANSTKRRPRWLSFSLRTLLLLMTLLCIWLGLQVNAARRQREAVAAILKAGGNITFDYQLVPIVGREPPNDRRYVRDTLPPGPASLRSLLGDEYFRDVIEVSFPKVTSEAAFGQLAELPRLRSITFNQARIVPDGSDIQRPISDADLAVFERLSQLERINLPEGDISGSGLAYVAKLAHLRTLVLDNSPVDDAGMEYIGKMTTIKCLGLDGARITDAGLKHLQNLTSLEILGLSDTEISGTGLAYLDSKYLQNLLLRNTHVDDAAMQQVGKMSALYNLLLEGTRVTDAGLSQLENLTNLERLKLDGTDVSDAGLEHLKGLTKLTDLFVQRTKVTPGGIRELQKSLPNTKIVGP